MQMTDARHARADDRHSLENEALRIPLMQMTDAHADGMMTDARADDRRSLENEAPEAHADDRRSLDIEAEAHADDAPSLDIEAPAVDRISLHVDIESPAVESPTCCSCCRQCTWRLRPRLCMQSRTCCIRLLTAMRDQFADPVCWCRLFMTMAQAWPAAWQQIRHRFM